MNTFETQPHREPQIYRTPLEIIRSGEKTERLEVINLHNVSHDSSIVDDNHAEQLGKSMQKDRGQLIPIGVIARERDGKPVYDIFDGFHRTAAMRVLGEETIKANVVYGSDDQELFDLRILAASSVGSVQFARVADWISQSYALTDWSKEGLPVSRAFSAALSNAQKINGYDFSETEVNAIKTWVSERTSKWGKNIGSVYVDLMVIANADPDVVSRVRMGSGGSDRAKLITPDRLKAVVKEFPGEEGYSMQNVLLDLAVEHKLRKPDFTRLISYAKEIELDGSVSDQTVLLSEQIVRILENPEVENRETVKSLKGRIAELTRQNIELAKRVADLENNLQNQQNSDRTETETVVFTLENTAELDSDDSGNTMPRIDSEQSVPQVVGVIDLLTTNNDETQQVEDENWEERRKEVVKEQFLERFQTMTQDDFLLHTSMMMSFLFKNKDILEDEGLDIFDPELAEEVYEAFEASSIRVSENAEQRWLNAVEFFTNFSEYCSIEDLSLRGDLDIILPFFDYVQNISDEGLKNIKDRAYKYITAQNKNDFEIRRQRYERSTNGI